MFDKLFSFVESVESYGYQVIIVGVGGVVYLLGMIVVKILVLVFGVLVQSVVLSGVDSFYFIVQMLCGILVGILVIGKVGVVNVGLFVVQIFVQYDVELYQCLSVWCQV